MKTQDTSHHTVSRIAMALNWTKALQLFVLALAVVFLLPALAVADDTDLGEVQQIDGKDQPNLHNLLPRTQPEHLWKRPDGTYYLKLGANKLEATGVKVKTTTGTYQIPNSTNQRVDNFHNDVNSFIDKVIAARLTNSPTSGASFFPLNLSTALDKEGDSSGMWEDTFTKTYGVVGFEVIANKLSVLGSLTSDGNSPIVYSFDASTEPWGLDLTGATQFTFAEDGTRRSAENGTEGWVLGTTPEPSSLFLLGSGILGVGGLLRKRLLT